MTIEDVKMLLSANGIPYEIHYYTNEGEFWRHLDMYAHVEKAKPYGTTVIVIRSKNGQKDIEIQFNTTEEACVFVDFFFGSYSFELFDWKEELLPNEMLRLITCILQCKFTVVTVHDLKRKRWIGDLSFDSENDYEESYYQREMAKINRPLSFLEKISRCKRQYEIYDFEKYQCVIKG